MICGLKAGEVRFVVVGGVAGRLHGSPHVTEDLDICYATSPDNLAALSELLADWQVVLRVGRAAVGAGADLPFTLDDALCARPRC